MTSASPTKTSTKLASSAMPRPLRGVEVEKESGGGLVPHRERGLGRGRIVLDAIDGLSR